jgi:hypothetical protein
MNLSQTEERDFLLLKPKIDKVKRSYRHRKAKLIRRQNDLELRAILKLIATHFDVTLINDMPRDEWEDEDLRAFIVGLRTIKN